MIAVDTLESSCVSGMPFAIAGATAGADADIASGVTGAQWVEPDAGAGCRAEGSWPPARMWAKKLGALSVVNERNAIFATAVCAL